MGHVKKYLRNPALCWIFAEYLAAIQHFFNYSKSFPIVSVVPPDWSCIFVASTKQPVVLDSNPL